MRMRRSMLHIEEKVEDDLKGQQSTQQEHVPNSIAANILDTEYLVRTREQTDPNAVTAPSITRSVDVHPDVPLQRTTQRM